MQRFWDQASVAPAPEGFSILLDGKPMRLPDGGPVLVVPNAALAHAVAAEWQAAGGGRGGAMSFADTPLTRIAGTAQGRVGTDPAPVIAALARYSESDLLCYRADAPETLVQRQATRWQPLLDWAAATYGARLAVTSGIVFVQQDPGALAALHAAVAGCDPPMLAALGVAVPALGSLVLGLALAARRLDAAEAHALAALDELHQAELWGEDDEAAARRAQVAEDVAVAARFMDLLRR